MTFLQGAGLILVILGFMTLWFHLGSNDPDEAFKTFFVTIILVVLGVALIALGTPEKNAQTPSSRKTEVGFQL